MKLGKPTSVANLPARKRTPKTEYSDLIQRVLSLSRDQAFSVPLGNPPKKNPAHAEYHRIHLAFRNRIAAVVRRATADIPDHFKVYLTRDGVGIVREKAKKKVTKKAVRKKARKKAR